MYSDAPETPFIVNEKNVTILVEPSQTPNSNQVMRNPRGHYRAPNERLCDFRVWHVPNRNWQPLLLEILNNPTE